MAIDVHRAVTAFIDFGDRAARGSNTFYDDIGERLGIAKDVIYITQTLVGDGFVVRTHLCTFPLSAPCSCLRSPPDIPSLHGLGS